jgi:hypothetical protein
MTQDLRKELGKYLLDVSKLVFGGAVVAGIMKEEIHLGYVLGIGILAALAFATWGFRLLNTKKTQ